MAELCFRADYGHISRTFFTQGRITNPAELIRGDALYRLLSLCGADDKQNGASASDWELFSSFCRAYPLAVGHPLARSVAELFRTRFDITELPCEDNRMRLWNAMVDRLEVCPCVATEVLPSEVGWLCDGLELPDVLPNRLMPVLDGNLLLHLPVGSRETWCSEIGDTVRSFARSGCRECVLRLDADFSFCKPNLYSVGEALKKKKRTWEDVCLLTAQLFRELCAVASEEDVAILLETHCSHTVTELLDFADQSVGLPNLYVSADDRRTRDAVIDRMSRQHRNPIAFVIRHADVPSDFELVRTLEDLSGRYPLGRLCLVGGADLRQTRGIQAYMRACLNTVLEKSFEKS